MVVGDLSIGGVSHLYLAGPAERVLFLLRCFLDLRSACLIGSGTLFRDDATTSAMAVSSDTLCPTDTYTGLGAWSDVRRAWKFNQYRGDDLN